MVDDHVLIAQVHALLLEVTLKEALIADEFSIDQIEELQVLRPMPLAHKRGDEILTDFLLVAFDEHA